MANVGALIGSWKMDAWTRTSVETGETTDAMGPEPVGYIAYHADGRMMGEGRGLLSNPSILCRLFFKNGRRTSPTQPACTKPSGPWKV